MKLLRALPVVALAAACGTPPDSNACAGIVTVPLDQGTRGPNGEWIVGSWTSPRIHYPALTTLAIRHGLGRAPVDVECYASFTVNGAWAQQIGNACEVLPRCDTRDGVSDTEVLVRNAGAQDFWARFVIR